MMLQRKLVFTSGLKDFEMVEKQLKMMRVVEDQQPQKTMKKLNLVKEDRQLMVYQIAETVAKSVGSAHSICITIYASASFRHNGCQKHCTQISSISEVNCQR